MRILRVVGDYWPQIGGNERWNFVLDKWFSETAGDEVEVLVLRPESVVRGAARTEGSPELSQPGPLSVPDLPKVTVYQDIFPATRGIALMRDYGRLLRPWIRKPVDVVVTQFNQFHSYFAWEGKPVSYEPAALPVCVYGRHVNCRRNRLFCAECVKVFGLRDWIKERLKFRLYRRFDLIAHNELTIRDLAKIGLAEKGFLLRHIVDPAELQQPLTAREDLLKKERVDRLASRHPIVLFQFNRLADFKQPSFLLDVAARIPDSAVVFAGDGPERRKLETIVRDDPSLTDRVLFLGGTPAGSIGEIARKASAFVLTSPYSNHNTSLFETMALGSAPVAAIDTGDFPEGFGRRTPILRLPSQADGAAKLLIETLRDTNLRRRMVEAALQYVKTHHSPDQLWRYRERLRDIRDRHRGK